MQLKSVLAVMILCASFSGQLLTSAPGNAFPDYDALAKIGETVEISVEAKAGVKYEWTHDGSGKLEPGKDNLKANWTAPLSAGKVNPALVTIISRNEKGAITGTLVKKIAVFGGEIIDQTLLFFCDGAGPARLFKSSPNQVKEVRYKWEIMRGIENVVIVPEEINKPAARFKTIAMSQTKNNVEIKLTYTLETGKEKKIFEAVKQCSVKVPAALKSISRENKIEEGPDIFGYHTLINYQVLDQFNEPLQAEGIVITQDITLVSNPYQIPPKSIKVNYNQYVTDAEGQIGSSRYISALAPLLEKFEVIYEQDLYVNDACLLEKLDIMYSRFGVQEKPNRERETRRAKLVKGKKKTGDIKDWKKR